MDRPNEAAITDWIKAKLAEILEISPNQIDTHTPFEKYGLDSVSAVLLSSKLEDWLGRRLKATLAYQYPTIEALAHHLATNDPKNE